MSTVDDVLDEFVDYDDDVDDIERIVEGNQNEMDTQSNDGRAMSDEAEEDNQNVESVMVEPKKAKVVRNPRITLNPARLTGPRGLEVIKDHFKDFKFKGKGHEKEDLDMVMKTLEHWAHRLYPKFMFDDCLEKIEHLGNKKIVSTHVRLIHLNMSTDHLRNDVVDDEDDAGTGAAEIPQEKDDFDILLEQQIALARSTPGSNAFTPKSNQATPFDDLQRDPISDADRTPLTPLNTYNHPPMVPYNNQSSLSEELKQRILRNKQLAEERRKNKMMNDAENNPDSNRDKENVDGVHNPVDISNERLNVLENDTFNKYVRGSNNSENKTTHKNGQSNDGILNGELTILKNPSEASIVVNIDDDTEPNSSQIVNRFNDTIEIDDEPQTRTFHNDKEFNEIIEINDEPRSSFVNIVQCNDIIQINDEPQTLYNDESNDIVEINDEPSKTGHADITYRSKNLVCMDDIVHDTEHTNAVELVYNSEEENEDVCMIDSNETNDSNKL